LEEIWPKLDSEWPKFAKNLKESLDTKLKSGELEQSLITSRIFDTLNSPPIIHEKSFNGILLTHNLPLNFYNKIIAILKQKKVVFYATQDIRLSPDSWTVKNENIFVAEGIINNTSDDADFVRESKELMNLIDKEERTNFDKLKIFIAKNPNNFIAKDLYCEKAVNYLPDKDIESAIYNFTSATRTPITSEMYSQMQDKPKWSALIQRIITELLAEINEAPTATSNDINPWLRLSRWEDLDISKFSIDWHSLVHDIQHWHNPSFYVTSGIMPEVVFVKYLRQAEKKSDWKAILSACETRYDYTKGQCRNEQILNIWTLAENAVKTLPHLQR